MNITSLLITLAGIIFIVALYIISRISQSKLPSKQTSRLPNLKDENGTRFTSVLDDIPARDGSTPEPDNLVQETDNNKSDKSTETISETNVKTTKNDNNKKENTVSNKTEQQQHILFITGRNENGLDGKLVQQALIANGLVLGDMDIYHYFPVMKDSVPESEKYSLFRIANGVSPWTLKPEDLLSKKLAGLSIVMITPTKINDSEAISLFISLSEKICKQIGGVLKNQQQQLFTAKEKKYLLYLYKK
ncbi:MAG TPA: hypothetical protein EYH20_01105 [Leucothrix sp.]|nr:hypothetical protein [Leucothrix sp.]